MSGERPVETLTVRTRKPEKWLLVDRENGSEWEWQDGRWRRAEAVGVSTVVSWSGRRHYAADDADRNRRGEQVALCSPYTWGSEPNAQGKVTTGTKQGRMARDLPLCKTCAKIAAADGAAS